MACHRHRGGDIKMRLLEAHLLSSAPVQQPSLTLGRVSRSGEGGKQGHGAPSGAGRSLVMDSISLGGRCVGGRWWELRPFSQGQYPGLTKGQFGSGTGCTLWPETLHRQAWRVGAWAQEAQPDGGLNPRSSTYFLWGFGPFPFSLLALASSPTK